jgi:hypothetical protein
MANTLVAAPITAVRMPVAKRFAVARIEIGADPASESTAAYITVTGDKDAPI